MKNFEVPIIYRSPLISAIKKKRKEMDKMKKDFTPTLLDFGPLQIYLARHFGFCYGVENAIEIAFRTVEENPGKKIYLLSEMIHNPAGKCRPAIAWCGFPAGYIRKAIDPV